MRVGIPQELLKFLELVAVWTAGYHSDVVRSLDPSFGILEVGDHDAALEPVVTEGFPVMIDALLLQ